MKVWKYTIQVGDEVDVDMPLDAELLHVAATGSVDHLELWARVEPTRSIETRRILVRGTGHPVEIEPYVGTVIVGPLVWHVFDGGAV
jgi:hypothetical protein